MARAKAASTSKRGAAPVRSSGVRKKNLSLNDTTLETIEELKAGTDASTAAEVVRRALAFYAMAVRKQKQGARIVYEEPDGRNTAFIFL